MHELDAENGVNLTEWGIFRNLKKAIFFLINRFPTPLTTSKGSSFQGGRRRGREDSCNRLKLQSAKEKIEENAGGSGGAMLWYSGSIPSAQDNNN